MRVEAHDVTVRIDGRDVVRRATLACTPGTMTALVGPSGSGKTTLLHCLGLLQGPTSGRILIDGTDATAWKAPRRRRFWKDHAAFVLQDHGVMDEESVAFNVTMSASPFTSRVRGHHQRLQAALDKVGLRGRETEPASHLSGGEKQRLSIARAIYKDARVVYVDEPTASLDEDNRATVIELFVSRARHGCAVVVSTHDDKMIAACSARHSLRQDLGRPEQPSHQHTDGELPDARPTVPDGARR